MNYSTLLERSVDFEPYARASSRPRSAACSRAARRHLQHWRPVDTPLGLYDNYPNELERPLIFSLMQMLWDRAEANGYAAPHDRRPAARHAAAHGADARRPSATTRSPTSPPRSRRGRSAPGLPAGARRRAHRDVEPHLRDPGDPARSRTRARRSSTGTAARSASSARTAAVRQRRRTRTCRRGHRSTAPTPTAIRATTSRRERRSRTS